MIAVCSFASASSSTRPCWLSTRRMCRVASNVTRPKSPFIMFLLGHEDHARVDRSRCVLVEPGLQIHGPLRLVEVVVHAHLGFVIGTALDLVGTRHRELAV